MTFGWKLIVINWKLKLLEPRTAGCPRNLPYHKLSYAKRAIVVWQELVWWVTTERFDKPAIPVLEIINKSQPQYKSFSLIFTYRAPFTWQDILPARAWVLPWEIILYLAWCLLSLHTLCVTAARMPQRQWQRDMSGNRANRATRITNCLWENSDSSDGLGSLRRGFFCHLTHMVQIDRCWNRCSQLKYCKQWDKRECVGVCLWFHDKWIDVMIVIRLLQYTFIDYRRFSLMCGRARELIHAPM